MGTSTLSAFRFNNDSQDISVDLHRPMPRYTKEPAQDISTCLREAMTIPSFNGKTSRFIDVLISEGWNIAQERIRLGIMQRYPTLTKNAIFAVAVCTLELQATVDDAQAEDEFYHQFGNVLRYRNIDEMAKLKPYVYHFVQGLEALPKYQGTLW